MADYHGTWKTNEFSVSDPAAFEALLDRIPDADYSQVGEGRYAMRAHTDSEFGEIPGLAEAEDDSGEYEEIDFIDLVAPLLADGEVMTLRFVTSNRHGDIQGAAVAVNAAGDRREIDLSNIETLANELRGNG